MSGFSRTYISMIRGNNLKLYKFLIITDTVLEAVINESVKEGDISNYHKNSIFTLSPKFLHNELCFMRFQYPNGGTYRWAYVIVDNDAVGEICKYKWGTTKDKIGNNHQSKTIKKYDNPYRVVDNDKTELILTALNEYGQDYDIKSIKQYRYIKMGGWLNNPQPEIGFLHKYLISDYGKKQIDKNLRVHHKGHTFDNRRAFLKEVSIGKHRIIHNRWESMDNSTGIIRSNLEPEEIFYRAEKIILGDCFSRDLECYRCNHDCMQCNGVLLIDTVEALRILLDNITSKEYRKLDREIVYSLIK